MTELRKFEIRCICIIKKYIGGATIVYLLAAKLRNERLRPQKYKIVYDIHIMKIETAVAVFHCKGLDAISKQGEN